MTCVPACEMTRSGEDNKGGTNIQNVQIPDFYLNGVKTEIKTLKGSSLNTPVTRI